MPINVFNTRIVSRMMRSKTIPNEASGILSMDTRVWKRRLDVFYGWLTRPVHASSLCLFRIVYAYVMMAQILKWSDMFEKFQVTLAYHVHASCASADEHLYVALPRGGLDQTGISVHGRYDADSLFLFIRGTGHWIYDPDRIYYELPRLCLSLSHLSFQLQQSLCSDVPH